MGLEGLEYPNEYDQWDEKQKSQLFANQALVLFY